MSTTAKMIERALVGMLDAVPDEFGDSVAELGPEFGCDSDDVALGEVNTFEDAGVMTSNAGIVLRLSDGSEYQITVVKSR